MTPAKPKAASSAVKRSKMIEVAKFSTRKSEEKTKKKRKRLFLKNQPAGDER